MMIRDHVRLYHITPIRNLVSIVTDGGLHTHKHLQQIAAPYVNIAYGHIQDRRSRKDVPCGPRGKLHDYVPFYFASRSPMLYALKRGLTPHYTEGQQPVLHLCTSVQQVIDANERFVFTDGHRTMEWTTFFADVTQLDQIDWDVIEAEYWRDTIEDPGRKRRRQTEFLIYSFAPWSLITGIGVINEVMKTQVEAILFTTAHQPPVRVLPQWYY